MTARVPVESEAAQAEEPTLRRLSIDEYHKMIDAGILGEDEHVQLVGGLLVASGQTFTPERLPGLSIAVADLFR